MHPLRNGNAQYANAFRSLILGTAGIDAVSLTAAIAEHAADLRARYNLRTPDAVQVATALHSGCDAFLTNDRDLRRVTEIPILVLDELTMS